MNYLGIDLGTSSIKVSLLDGQSLKQIGSAQSPADEMEMIAHRPSWAEQNPESWWNHLILACKALKTRHAAAYSQVSAIGISYQMHGLVVTNERLQPLRPAILWCDSRAVTIGEEAYQTLGKDNCLAHFLNSPGNFTASKLRWVKENEPSVYDQIHHVLLPGDYLAACLTGEVSTTLSGLSEGILWDFMNHKPAHSLLTYYDLAEANLPVVGNSFGAQGNLKSEVAAELGLPSHVSLCYRGGDQLTNALALGVTEPGQVAADAGTSGTIVGLSSKPVSDPLNRINTFAHVNHTLEKPRYAVLACLNGAGSFYSWVRRLIGADTGFLPSYEILNDMSAGIHPGCDHLRAYPFGNGAERMLHNQNPGGSFVGLNFNVHTPGHLLRATQEGIIFGLKSGLEAMDECGFAAKTIRAGHANLFLSPLFRQIFADVTQCELYLVDSSSSQGAAIGAAIGCGKLKLADLNTSIKTISTTKPDSKRTVWYQELYLGWKNKIELG